MEGLQMSKAANNLRLLRRELGRESILEFARIYFPQYTKEKFSEFHRDISKSLMEISTGGHTKRTQNKRLAFAAPRGHAKSTIVTLFYVIWSICYDKERFIFILSATSNQAQKLLSEIKAALQSNERIKQDFPEVFARKENVKTKWTQQEIITDNDICIAAYGWEQDIRGLKHHEDRPTLFILDDVDGDKNTYTAQSREKVSDWFNSTILKGGAKVFNVVAVGTLIHPDSLLAKLTNKVSRPDFESEVYKAVIKFSERKDLWQKWSNILFNRKESYEDGHGLKAADAFFNANKTAMLEGTKVLWPEMENYYTLMKIREIEGSYSFDSEKQNDPVNTKDSRYDPEKFHYWDDDGKSEKELIASFGNDFMFIAACDPSVGIMDREADHSAIITLAKHKGKLYVIDADIAPRPQDHLVQSIINYAKIRIPMDKFLIEGNLFPELLVKYVREQAQRDNILVPLKEIRSTSNKELRIFGMEAYITTGTILFSKRHTELLEQLKYFPRGEHDDGPDALEMALRGAEIGNVSFEELTEKRDKYGRDINDRNYGQPSPADDADDEDDGPPAKWFTGH